MKSRYSKVMTSVFWGIEGHPVEIETQILGGLPYHTIVGLPSTVIKESKERVKAAIKSIGMKFPDEKIVQNMYPANLKKEGSHLDLPIAVGIFLSQCEALSKHWECYGFIGELSLDGKIQPVQGILSLVDGLKAHGIRHLIIPYENLPEAQYIEGITLYPYKSLGELFDHLKRGKVVNTEVSIAPFHFEKAYDIDFSEVWGQDLAIRALQVAVTGFHNVLIIGPPGCGKSMIAERMKTIMPEMSLAEQIEITKIYGISNGEQPKGILTERPFRAPHHTISRIGLVGGGNQISPGEISRAHRGILYLDEIGEFRSDAIESLREPLSNKMVNLSKGGRALTFPSDFMLVATMNPCPCGHYLSDSERCTCSHLDVQRYFGKLSWPILDRFDMLIYMNRVTIDDPLEQMKGRTKSSKRIREEIISAINKRSTINDEISPDEISPDEISPDAEALILKYHQSGKLSMRGYEKLVKLARTIAALEGVVNISSRHVLEAVRYHTGIQIDRFFK
ncbi:MAG: YifB family Mg chelatase-like AAA ATPase [Firmicutes bacterium]|nr:YifB family Mg chelatase-like AAA ATPase [Bacillota bacterium]